MADELAIDRETVPQSSSSQLLFLLSDDSPMLQFSSLHV